MPPNGDAVRLRAPTKRTRRANAVGNNGDAPRRRDLTRAKLRRRQDERNRRVALAFFASFLFFSAVLFLVLHPRTHRYGSEYERYTRAKALREAALSGEEAGIWRRKKWTNYSGKPGEHKWTNGMRYLDPRQLPPLPGQPKERYNGKGRKGGFRAEGDDAWVADANDEANKQNHGPKVDYTKHNYEYPELASEPMNDGSYPPLERMASIFETWGQDDLDSPPETIKEVLQHFDYQDPAQVKAAIKYRDLELPFKVYNVPEVMAATSKWTDEYVAKHFNGNSDGMPQSSGACQQSVDSFFAFHRPPAWSVDVLGPPPSLDVNWTFDKWAKHAVYADEASLSPSKTHYYWQAGVPREERLKHKKTWTFVSRDLPSFSNPEPTFFGFNPPEQKGIQCRFGERGVTAATHYDGGRNMIAMMTGAKRYILSPPNACPKLGIVTARMHPSYRHSMLNFGRVTQLDKEWSEEAMSQRERDWLRISAEAPTLSTVLKAGEVLYVPSHWFHYIVSLQKSAQCNTRSGVHEEGNVNFGGLADVEQCIADGDDQV